MAVLKEYLMRVELTRESLVVELAKHTAQGANREYIYIYKYVCVYVI